MMIDLTVEVAKEDLLTELRLNLEKHKEEYQAARDGYRMVVEEQIDALQTAMEDSPDTFVVSSEFRNLQPPKSHIKEYRQAISMLEMSVNETIGLDARQYACFVQDEWEWKHSWELSNRALIIKSSGG